MENTVICRTGHITPVPTASSRRPIKTSTNDAEPGEHRTEREHRHRRDHDLTGGESAGQVGGERHHNAHDELENRRQPLAGRDGNAEIGHDGGQCGAQLQLREVADERDKGENGDRYERDMRQMVVFIRFLAGKRLGQAVGAALFRVYFLFRLHFRPLLRFRRQPTALHHSSAHTRSVLRNSCKNRLKKSSTAGGRTRDETIRTRSIPIQPRKIGKTSYLFIMGWYTYALAVTARYRKGIRRAGG